MTLLIDAPALIRRPAGLVRIRGEERLAYLHTQLSQSLEDAAPGSAADFLYLDPKGNHLAAGRAHVRGEEVWLLTPPEVAADLTAALEKFKFLMQVEAADASDEVALASVRGPKPPAVAGAPDAPMTFADEDEGLVVRDRSGGVDLLGAPAWVEQRVTLLDVPEADLAAWEAWRIHAGEPSWEHEIGAAGRRSEELGLLPTHVHLRKGCYPGQESIAKIHNLGRPRRALCVLELDGPATQGAAVELPGTDARPGEITSAGVVEDGRSVALALLPVDADGALPGEGTVRVGETNGRISKRVGEGLDQPGGA